MQGLFVTLKPRASLMSAHLVPSQRVLQEYSSALKPYPVCISVASSSLGTHKVVWRINQRKQRTQQKIIQRFLLYVQPPIRFPQDSELVAVLLYTSFARSVIYCFVQLLSPYMFVELAVKRKVQVVEKDTSKEVTTVLQK